MVGDAGNEAALVLWVIVGVLLVWLIARIPYMIAKSRGNPHAEAIFALSIFGVVTLGLLWIVAFVWAFMAPARPAASTASGEADAMRLRMLELEAKIAELQVRQGGDATVRDDRPEPDFSAMKQIEAQAVPEPKIIACLACGARLKVPPGASVAARKIGKCPKCGQPVKIA